MKGNILRDAQGNITVHMEGDLDYEYAIPFKEELTALAKRNPHSVITIDLAAVDFVGSSGICHFVETVHHLNRNICKMQKVKVSNTTKEFNKVFKLYTLDEAEIFWNEFDLDSDDTANMAQSFAGRKRTFEN